MTRTSFVILFTLFLSSYLVKGQILTGPKVGLNLSTMHFDEKQYTRDYETVWRPGFSGGWVFNYSASKSTVWSFHGELYYSTKGRTIQKRGLDYVKNVTRFHNIDMPAMFRGTFQLGSLKWYVNAGPALSYWVYGNGQISSSELDEGKVGTVNYHYDFTKYDTPRPDERDYPIANGIIEVPNANRLQVGLSFGGGFEFPVLEDQIVQLDFRYNMGHTNIGEKEDNFFGLNKYKENFEGSNRNVEISLAFLLDYNTQLRKKGRSTSKIK
mgnify:FL=1|tara:strand:+ start:1699 stop:2502 length:804 start_codon:yes stop_codon:yes gene_type:complete